jgi:lysozyme
MTIFDQLRRDEGLRTTVYADPATGVPTIGYGHNLRTAISTAAAEQILRDDVAAVAAQLSQYPWFGSLTEARQAVCLNMAYNLGVAGFLAFAKTIEAIRRADWPLAAAEMLNSRWARQVGQRAQRLAIQMETDRWQ